MVKLHDIMFPSLEGTWGDVDLNECVKSFPSILGKDRDLFNTPNPLLDRDNQIEFVDKIHRKMGRDYSYGGYLEDRSILWRGHYHDPSKMIHLGVDFNVPAGTEVRLPFVGDLTYAHYDEDQNGGWGGRLDFRSQTENVYFILGHLDEKTISQYVGRRGWYPQRHFIGHVGKSSENGGWFPHLHLQMVRKEEYESKDPMKIDGYGAASPNIRKQYPNPECFLLL